MMEKLKELIATLAVLAIPIGLIWSFMVNHDLAPNGKDSKPKKDNSSESSKDGGENKPEG